MKKQLLYGLLLSLFLINVLPQDLNAQTHCCCPNCPNMTSTYECITNTFGTCGASCAITCGDPTGFIDSNSPTCADVACSPPAPVELEFFKAERTDDGVALKWKTASEEENAGFEILRASGVELRWELINFIEGNGTTVESEFYTYLDKTPPPGTHYYRLKQIDFDGSAYLSQIEVATIYEKEELQLWPTLARDQVIINAKNTLLKEYNYVVVDMLGNKVMEDVFVDATALNISHLSKGHYIINIFSDNGDRQTLRFVKAE